MSKPSREHVPLRVKALPSFGDVQAQRDSVGYGALNLMISSLIGFGLPAYLLDRWLGSSWLVLIGLLAGMAFALTVVWFRYGTGRHAATDRHADVTTTQAATTEDHG
ncbi:MAG: hypothetical protein ACK5MT_08405 [Actinomycetales bacterium]